MNIILDHTSPRTATGERFRGELFEPQKAMLNAMKHMEKKQLFAVGDPVDGYVGQFSAAKLSCKYGSGKTVMSVALVSDMPFPRQVPIQMNYIGEQERIPFRSGRDFNEFSDNFNDVSEWYPTVRIPATLIIASASVITQWEEHLWNFTPHVPFLTITSSKDLAELKVALDARKFPWKVVLLKNGMTNYGFSAEERAGGARQSTLSAMYDLCKDLVWSRIMVDDYDTIGLRGDDPAMHAFFTWYISASSKVNKWHRCSADESFPLLGAAQDTPVINLNEDFLKTMIVLPPPKFYTYTMPAPAAVKLLVEFTNDGDFLEAVKSGAYNEAGGMKGIRCNNVAQLFMGLLGKNLEKFSQYKIDSETLEALKARHGGTSGKRLPKGHAQLFVSAVVKGHDDGSGSTLPVDISKYSNFTHVHSVIAQRLGNIKMRMQDIQQRIDRFKDNIAEQTCQVCYLDDDMNEKIIMGCCQLIVCPVCFGKDGKGVNRHCPGCSTPISSFLLIGENINVQEASDADCADVIAASPEASPKDPLEHLEPKPRLLVTILRGEPCEAPIEGDWSIDNLITGANGNTLPDDPPDGVRRIMLYYGHSGACNYITGAMDSAGIPFTILRGTPSARKKAIEDFRTDDPKPIGGKKFKLILVFAETSSAGIHLPEATDIIFFTHFQSTALLQQVAGRGQRPGRKCRLKIHRFQYA